MLERITALLLLIQCGTGVANAGEGIEGDVQTAPSAAAVAPGDTLQDQLLAPYRLELLELAMDAATAIPVEPHVKDRSRMQEEVAEACLELQLPIRAESYAAQIENWRRGAVYAELARYSASQGFDEDARRFLRRAMTVQNDADGWQRDRIRMKMAGAYVWLGASEQADEFSRNVVPAEMGKDNIPRARAAEPADVADLLTRLRGLAAATDFEQVRNALDSGAQLFNRFYRDDEIRSEVELFIRESWMKVPVQLRITLIVRLGESALANDDTPRAVQLADEAQIELYNYNWLPEDSLPMLAMIASLRHRAGDLEKGRTDIDDAMRTYVSYRDQIQNYDRADVLRPIAEAYQAIGDSPAALTVYRQALEEGAINRNARPRAIDLSRTCRSMAAAGVEPDAAFQTRATEIYKGLNTPW